MNDESNRNTDENETVSSSDAVVTVTASEEIPASAEETADTHEEIKESEEIIDQAEEIIAEAEAIAENSAETRNKSKSSTKKLLWLLTIPAAAIIFLSGVFIRARFPFHAELGKDAEVFPSPLISCDVSRIDTHITGEHTLDAKLFGFISSKVTLEVSDTTPPSLTLKRPVIMAGASGVLPEDFIESCEDEQSVTFSFENTPDFENAGAVKLKAVDASGNQTTVEAEYDQDEKLSDIRFELGTSESAIMKKLTDLTGADKKDITGLDTESAGTSTVRAVSDRYYIFPVIIEDTTPPSGEPNDLDILIGTRFIGDEIARLTKNVSDESAVSYSFVKEPDWDKSGTQNVIVGVTDESGNTTEIKSKIKIHDIPSEITIEAGTTSDELKTLLLANDDTAGFDEKNLMYPQFGMNEYVINGEFNDMTVKVKVEDTIPPLLVMRDLETDRGATPYAGSFVESFEDATAVSFEYETEPDVNSIGKGYVTIIATDAGGNVTRGIAILTVIADTTPPVIYGVKDIYAYEGDTISYRAGVRAEDAADGRVTVYVDSSNVKTSTAGSYKITYRATDSSGNTATETAYVHIRQVTQATIDSLADEILNEILTYGMTEREKARAIYDWCRENLKYSTVTSYLMGYYYKAAYSGYKLRYGNCYTYYAVSRSLLTRAGITNQMIKRNNASRPHYWNLVNIDGSWYHFDTCPQPYPNNDGCFLLTDAEVAAYSRTKEAGYYDFVRGVYPATP